MRRFFIPPASPSGFGLNPDLHPVPPDTIVCHDDWCVKLVVAAVSLTGFAFASTAPQQSNSLFAVHSACRIYELRFERRQLKRFKVNAIRRFCQKLAVSLRFSGHSFSRGIAEKRLPVCVRLFAALIDAGLGGGNQQRGRLTRASYFWIKEEKKRTS